MEQLNSMQDVKQLAKGYTNSQEDVNALIEKIRQFKDVPDELSKEFMEKYGKNGKRTVQEAVKSLIKDVNNLNE